MRTIRLTTFAFLAVLLAGAARAAEEGTVQDEELNFTISLPDSLDWKNEKPAPENPEVRVHFLTEYADTDPPARCDVWLVVRKLTRDTASDGLDQIANRWKHIWEQELDNQRDEISQKGTLGETPCWSRSIKGELTSGVGHVSWDIARMGNYLYILYVRRAYKAVDDEALEEEIKEIRDSFKFLKIVEVKAHKKADKKDDAPPAVGPKETGPSEDDLKREQFEEKFWRLKYVKPAGLVATDPTKFSKAETDANVIARFGGAGEQTSIQIRIHAESENAQKYTIEQLAESVIKHFQADKSYKDQKEPEIDKDVRKKIPLAKEALQLTLKGRRSVPDTTLWFMAQCKNERQYRISIFIAGANAEQAWKKQIDDFLKNFKPQKD